MIDPVGSLKYHEHNLLRSVTPITRPSSNLRDRYLYMQAIIELINLKTRLGSYGKSVEPRIVPYVLCYSTPHASAFCFFQYGEFDCAACVRLLFSSLLFPKADVRLSHDES